MYQGPFNEVPTPNITAVYYGCDVGDVIERTDIDAELQKVSATSIRERIVGGS